MVKSLSSINLEKTIIRELTEMGRIAKTTDLADQITGGKSNQSDRARVAFIAALSPNLTVIDQSDNYNHQRWNP